MADKSSLERTWETLWTQLAPKDIPVPVMQYRFSQRRWRFDAALVDAKIAIELEGGVWTGGRHTTGSGFTNDCAKYNTATVNGWAILRFTSTMLRIDPASCVDQVVTLYRARALG